MTEYFNQGGIEYNQLLKQGNLHYKIRLELLADTEIVIGEITKDIAIDADGQININYQQLTRRSCSLTLMNVDGKYTPSQNSWFWYDRKFKLWLGVVDRQDNVYWFSQGVYYTLSATGDSYVLNIEGIDKGGALDGTLKTNMIDGQFVVEAGNNIKSLIEDTLILEVDGQQIDSKKPIVDIEFSRVTTGENISINENEYLGDLYTDLGDSYGADVYYDIEGRLNFTQLCDGNRVDGYRYMASQYDFFDTDPHYRMSEVNYNFEGVNAVTVYTNISATDSNGNSIQNVSYTSYNNNPLSPLRTSAVKVRRLEPQQIAYVDIAEELMLKRCKEYADYLLLRNALQDMSISFSATIIPHIDVNRTVTITDKAKGFDSTLFVVQSVTIPLSAGEMNIQATQANWLPSDTNIEGSVI